MPEKAMCREACCFAYVHPPNTLGVLGNPPNTLFSAYLVIPSPQMLTQTKASLWLDSYVASGSKPDIKGQGRSER